MAQSIDIITALPTALSCILLWDWLKLKSVLTLDTAYCSHTLRESFVTLLRSEGFCIRDKVLLCGKKLGVSLNGLLRVGDKLRQMTLHDSLTPEQLKSVLTHCRHLTRLHIMCLETCTPDAWDALRANRNLERLEISLCARGRSSKNVPPFTRLTLPKLRYLALYGYPLESHHFVGAMKLSKQLVCLDFKGCEIKPAVLKQIPVLCPGLKSLGLASVDVSNEILNELTVSCPSIVHLNIAGNFQITDEGLSIVLQNLPSLQSLCMQNVPMLTDVSLTHIQTFCCKTLHTLFIGNADDYGSPIFAHRAVNELLEHCTELRTFYWQEPDRRNDDVFPLSTAALRHLSTLLLCGLDVYKMNLATFGQNVQRSNTGQIAQQPLTRYCIIGLKPCSVDVLSCVTCT